MYDTSSSINDSTNGRQTRTKLLRRESSEEGKPKKKKKREANRIEGKPQQLETSPYKMSERKQKKQKQKKKQKKRRKEIGWEYRVSGGRLPVVNERDQEVSECKWGGARTRIVDALVSRLADRRLMGKELSSRATIIETSFLSLSLSVVPRLETSTLFTSTYEPSRHRPNIVAFRFDFSRILRIFNHRTTTRRVKKRGNSNTAP